MSASEVALSASEVAKCASRVTSRVKGDGALCRSGMTSCARVGPLRSIRPPSVKMPSAMSTGSARRTSLDGGSETRMIRQATTM